MHVCWKNLNKLFIVCRKYLEYTVEIKHRSGRRKLVDDRAARRLVRQTRVDRKRPLLDVTSKCNENNNVNVSSKTIWS